MEHQLNRRDFLKLAGSLSFSWGISSLSNGLRFPSLLPGNKKNIIIVVFDAFTAYDLPIYGYSRLTAPNIARLSKKAIVYHNHFTNGSFTTPGTASLLTGVLPWTHRAFQPNTRVAPEFSSKTIFSALPNHHRIAFTHNGWAYTLLRQFRHDIDELISREKLLLNSSFDKSIAALFRNDDDISSVGWERIMQTEEDGSAYSLFLSHIYENYKETRIKDIRKSFPLGLPGEGTDNFILETAIDTIWKQLSGLPQPFLGYFHMLPPHAPYRTSREFFNAFKGDNFHPISKPVDIFGKQSVEPMLSEERRRYDEYILYCDREFGRLYDHLEASGLLDNAWLILTSDHGEMHERGIDGHMTDAFYQPLVRVPLMIFEPGRDTGMDIHERTNAVDILPTLAYLNGEQIPAWSEGVVLPPFASTGNISNRNIYALRAVRNEQYAPLTEASVMLVKENYKLVYSFGIPNVPEEGLVRLFDIESDPEEMSDLYPSKTKLGQDLLSELKDKLREVNGPYR